MSGSLSAAQALPIIAHYESPNGNVRNYAYDATHTASGYYQITNSTWAQYAGSAGVDTSVYPTAMSAPQDVQTAVATQIYNAQGAAPWAAYDAPLRSALAAQGYTGNVGVYTGPLGTQAGSGGATMVNGVQFNADGSPVTYDGSAATPDTSGVSPNSPASAGAGAGFGSAGQAIATLGSGVSGTIAEIATRTSVLMIGLVLIGVGLVWAMMETKRTIA